jgi:hypothetical protein
MKYPKSGCSKYHWNRSVATALLAACKATWLLIEHKMAAHEHKMAASHASHLLQFVTSFPHMGNHCQFCGYIKTRILSE